MFYFRMSVRAKGVSLAYDRKVVLSEDRHKKSPIVYV